jgi:hypothetical protein
VVTSTARPRRRDHPAGIWTGWSLQGASSGRIGSFWTRRHWPVTWCRRGCMFAFPAAHRAEVFPDADYVHMRTCSLPGAGQALLDAGQAGVVVVVAAEVVMGSWLRRSSGRHLVGASNSCAQCGLERILELGPDQGGVQAVRRVETKPSQTSTPSRADIWSAVRSIPSHPVTIAGSPRQSRSARRRSVRRARAAPVAPMSSAAELGAPRAESAFPLRFNLHCSAELIAVRLPWTNSL